MNTVTTITPRPRRRLVPRLTMLDKPGVRSLPIVFKTPLVLRLLAYLEDGRPGKSVTRRIFTMKGLRPWTGERTPEGWPLANRESDGALVRIPCKYGEAGTLLYVQEALERTPDGLTMYVATRELVLLDGRPLPWRWQPAKLAARYCPKEASRLLLLNTGVRGEWLQEITEQEALDEGVEGSGTAWRGAPHLEWRPTAKWAFELLWDSIHTEEGESWNDNPGVFRVGLREVQRRQAGPVVDVGAQQQAEVEVMQPRPEEWPTDAELVPGLADWVFWQVPVPGREDGLALVYAGNAKLGVKLGPFDWKASSCWFHSGEARKAWVEKGDQEFYTQAVVVAEAICEALRARHAPPLPAPPAQLLIDLHDPQGGTCSYLEAVRAEKGFMPQGLAHVHPDDYRDYPARTLDEEVLERMGPYLKRHPHACPFPLPDPYLTIWGSHVATHAERLFALLSDGKWHSYAEVAAVAGEPGAHQLNIHRIAVWGDTPSRYGWQVPIYCHGRADSTGLYALWSAPVAVEHREARRAAFRAEARAGASNTTE